MGHGHNAAGATHLESEKDRTVKPHKCVLHNQPLTPGSDPTYANHGHNPLNANTPADVSITVMRGHIHAAVPLARQNPIKGL